MSELGTYKTVKAKFWPWNAASELRSERGMQHRSIGLTQGQTSRGFVLGCLGHAKAAGEGANRGLEALDSLGLEHCVEPRGVLLSREAVVVREHCLGDRVAQVGHHLRWEMGLAGVPRS